MKIDFHRQFDKQYRRLTISQKNQFKARLALFSEDQINPLLNNHGLRGSYAGYRSINVAGDLRAVFIQHSKEYVEFVYIGSHSQLYG